MTSIELTFLGTTASIPTPRRNHPSIYVRYSGRSEHVMLFDAGEGTQRQIFRYGLNFMRIDSIFITHWHADHFAGLLTLIQTMSLEKRKRPLRIYAPEADEFVDDILEIGYGIKSFDVVSANVDFERPSLVYENDEIEVHSFPVQHGVPAVGYMLHEKDRIKIDTAKLKMHGLPEKGRLIGKLKSTGSITWHGHEILLDDVSSIRKGKSVSYSGDTGYFDGIAEAMQADIIVSECTYLDSDGERFHLNLDQNREIFGKATPKLMVLTHFSRRYESSEMPDLPDGMVYAHDGMRVVYDDNGILVK